MKNTISIITLFFISLQFINAQAPSYVNFEFDILRLGMAGNQAEGTSDAGLYMGSELRFNLKDDLSIGLAWDFSFFSKDPAVRDGDTEWSRSSSLTVDKYFSTTSSRRFFAGTGIGRYSNGESLFDDEDNNTSTTGESSFGIAPRVGYELGHLRIMAQYHYTTKKEVLNYFSLNLGLTLWGGYNGK